MPSKHEISLISPNVSSSAENFKLLEEEATVKANVWRSPPAKGVLWWGFLGPSPTGQVSSHPSPKVLVVTSLSLVVKEDGVDEELGGYSLGTSSMIRVKISG
jgi:hypothetical protein